MEVVDVLTERLKKLMEEHRIKAAPLARAADLNESAVRDILRGRSKNPGIVTLQKIAAVLSLRPSALFEAGALWPIVGAVSEAGRIDEADGYIENPFFADTPAGLSALRVENDGLAPFAFTGDHLVFGPSDTVRTPGASRAGRPSVCVFADGRRAVRIVKPETDSSAVTLLPVNPYAPAEPNVMIASSLPIFFVLPAIVTTPGAVQTHVGSPSVHELPRPFRVKKSK